MHVALPGTSSDDVLISPDIIPVLVPPSPVLNNVFGPEDFLPTETTRHYPSQILNPAHYLDNL